MTARGLDFLAIGAAKSGTTSLHEYMRTHPALFLPEAKEQLFFTRDEAFEEGWEAFAATAFHGAPEDRLWGKIMATYLSGPVHWRDSTARQADAPAHVITARRIAGQFPDVKLIALLRDPVERAISDYWQHVVLGDENRAIDEAFEDQLSPQALESARARPTGGHYIVASEYGRLLAGYLECFQRSQLFVGSTQVLAEDPMALLGDLWRFLEVDDSHVPPNLGERFQTRGTGSRRVKALRRGPELIKRTPGLRHAWEALPAGGRARIRARFRLFSHRMDQRPTRVGDSRLQGRPSPELLERLRGHYADDIVLLEELVGPVPGVTGAGADREIVSH